MVTKKQIVKEKGKDTEKKIRIEKINPKIVGDALTELLYKYSNVKKSFTEGFFQVYNSIIEPKTQVGRFYEETTSTIEAATFGYIVADSKEDKDIQLILMGGLSRGKTMPFLQNSPALSILLQYGERKIDPDSKFCENFPFSDEFGAMIYAGGDLSDSCITSKVNDLRLETLVREITRELKMGTEAEGGSE